MNENWLPNLLLIVQLVLWLALINEGRHESSLVFLYTTLLLIYGFFGQLALVFNPNFFKLMGVDVSIAYSTSVVFYVTLCIASAYCAARLGFQKYPATVIYPFVKALFAVVSPFRWFASIFVPGLSILVVAGVIFNGGFQYSGGVNPSDLEVVTRMAYYLLTFFPVMILVGVEKLTRSALSWLGLLILSAESIILLAAALLSGNRNIIASTFLGLIPLGISSLTKKGGAISLIVKLYYCRFDMLLIRFLFITTFILLLIFTILRGRDSSFSSLEFSPEAIFYFFADPFVPIVTLYLALSNNYVNTIGMLLSSILNVVPGIGYPFADRALLVFLNSSSPLTLASATSNDGFGFSLFTESFILGGHWFGPVCFSVLFIFIMALMRVYARIMIQSGTSFVLPSMVLASSLIYLVRSQSQHLVTFLFFNGVLAYLLAFPNAEITSSQATSGYAK